MDTTKQIVEREWTLFDKVQNYGGRAACQNDAQTFFIMRTSQIAAWTEDMRQSYLDDLRRAQAAARNPLAEKYGYMMARTCPAEYEQLKDRLPPRTPEKDSLIDFICLAHIHWIEQLATRYPHLIGHGRILRKEQDSSSTTSLETYLWGELATYSLRTLGLYAAYVSQQMKEGRNMNEIILQNTVQQYGYASLDAAEAHLEAC